MRLEPADEDWKSMRIAPWSVPKFPADVVAQVEKANAVKPLVRIDAKSFSLSQYEHVRDGGVEGKAAWRVVPGLGKSGAAMTLFPMDAESFDLAKQASVAPMLACAVEFPSAGRFKVEVHLLPTHSLVSGRGLRFGLGLDDEAPQLVTLDIGDGGPDWAQGVLSGERVVTTSIEVGAQGKRMLRIYGVDAGVVIDQLVIWTVSP
ncbi:MAG: hypothetical protein QM760_17620 [Nibricoccus sp.]